MSVWICLACVAHVAAGAAEVDPAILAAAMRATPHAYQESRPRVPPARFQQAPLRDSPYAAAIASALKKGPVERAVEAYTDVLIQCQNEQSVVLTTALLRSDSQQSHCFRF